MRPALVPVAAPGVAVVPVVVVVLVVVVVPEMAASGVDVAEIVEADVVINNPMPNLYRITIESDVTIDANLPLAWKDLTFDIEFVEIP